MVRPIQKIPLFGCQMKEFQPERYRYSTFSLKVKNHTKFILKTKDEMDLIQWMNSILYHKSFIEEQINKITSH